MIQTIIIIVDWPNGICEMWWVSMRAMCMPNDLIY